LSAGQLPDLQERLVTFLKFHGLQVMELITLVQFFTLLRPEQEKPLDSRKYKPTPYPLKAERHLEQAVGQMKAMLEEDSGNTRMENHAEPISQRASRQGGLLC